MADIITFFGSSVYNDGEIKLSFDKILNMLKPDDL